jgi:hypothetical protein
MRTAVEFARELLGARMLVEHRRWHSRADEALRSNEGLIPNFAGPTLAERLTPVNRRLEGTSAPVSRAVAPALRSA